MGLHVNLINPLLTEFCPGHCFGLLKDLIEITSIRIPTGGCDVLNALISKAQQFLCIGNPLSCDIVKNGDAVDSLNSLFR